MNKNQTHFIRKDFTPNSLVSFEEFYINQDTNLKDECEKIVPFERLGSKVKKVSFTLEEDGNVYYLIVGIGKRINFFNPK